MSISLLETIEKLAVEANAADKRKSKQVAILQDEAVINKALTLDMKDEIERLKTESAEALSSSQLCKINNKSLLQELADMEVGLSAVQETNAIMSDLNKALQDENTRLKKIERERDVLSKDNKKLKDNLAKAKSKAEKPAKEKVNMKYMKLQETNAALNKYITELVTFGQTAPQFMGGLKHSTQGVMDFIDCKPEMMSVEDPKTQEVREVSVQRIIVINKHNSVKVMTRIIGEDGLHTVKIAKGCTVTIDDEVRDHVIAYNKTADEVDSKLKGVK